MYLRRLNSTVANFDVLLTHSKCTMLLRDWIDPESNIILAGRNWIKWRGLITWIVGSHQVVVQQNKRLAFTDLSHLWDRREIQLSAESRVYNETVGWTLLYGSETWQVWTEYIRRLPSWYSPNMVGEFFSVLRKFDSGYWPHELSWSNKSRVEIGEAGWGKCYARTQID